MRGNTKGDVPDARVDEYIRNAGRSFLASKDGALESLSALSARMQDFRRIIRGRAFAYDGQQAAILVFEDHTKIFCGKASDGVYNLRCVGVR